MHGDSINDASAVWMGRLGLKAMNEGLSIAVFDTQRERIIDALMDMRDMPDVTPEGLAESASNRIVDNGTGRYRKHPSSKLRLPQL